MPALTPVLYVVSIRFMKAVTPGLATGSQLSWAWYAEAMSMTLLSGLAGFGVGDSVHGVAGWAGVLAVVVVVAAWALPVKPTTTAGRVRATEPAVSARAPTLLPGV